MRVSRGWRFTASCLDDPALIFPRLQFGRYHWHRNLLLCYKQRVPLYACTLRPPRDGAPSPQKNL
jgi:hypothetical protein